MNNPYQQPMPAWPTLQAYASQVILPDGLHLHCYDSAGSGEPVFLLIHGLGDEADTWRGVFPALAQHGRVIAPDMPGFGRSDKPKTAYTIMYFCRVLLALMDQLQVERATLAGHSMGAVIAHQLALENPPRVSRLALLSGSLVASVTRLDLGTLLFLIPGLGEWMYNRLRRDPQAAFRTLAPYYRSLDGLPQAERDFLFQRVNQRVWSDDQRDAFLSALRGLAGWAPGQQKTLPVRLPGVVVPTLAVWGAADRINSIENGRLLARLQPSARLVEIPGAGHNLHQEDPQAVIKILEDWLAPG